MEARNGPHPSTVKKVKRGSSARAAGAAAMGFPVEAKTDHTARHVSSIGFSDTIKGMEVGTESGSYYEIDPPDVAFLVVVHGQNSNLRSWWSLNLKGLFFFKDE